MKKNEHERDNHVCMHENYEDNHVYLINGHSHLDLGYKSVTTFIADFFSKFDADAIINKYWGKWQNDKSSKYYQMSKDDICTTWKKSGEEACNSGTIMHEMFEYYVNEWAIRDPTVEIHNFKEWYVSEVSEPIRTEYTVYGDYEKIVGNIDFVYKNKKGETCIVDYKRTDVPDNNSYGKKCKGINLPDNKRSKHRMQLNIYKYLLEKYYDMKISHIYNLYIKDSNCDFIEHELMDVDKLIKQSFINHKDI